MWEGTGWRGRAVLYTLSFAGVAVALGTVAWSSGGDPVLMGLIPAAAVGHLLSASPTKRKLRLGIVIYPAAIAGMWLMRADLLTLFFGGGLFPLAKLLAIVQTMVSFNLRSFRGIYDSFLLSLVLILLASEGALSTEFIGFLFAYSLIALAFLGSVHPVSEARRARLLGGGRPVLLVAPVVLTIFITLAAGVVVFLAIPQVQRVQAAAPLPSRLDLTIGRPISPSPERGGESAPMANFLPSRQENGPSAPPQSGAAGGNGRSEVPGTGGGVESGDPTLGEEQAGAITVDDYVPLGYTGDAERDVVMHVRSPLASYWRGQVLEEYDGRGWTESDSASMIEVDRWGRLRFEDAPSGLRGVGRYVQSFFPAVEQPQAVFTGYSPGYIAVRNPTVQGNFRERAIENLRRLREAGSYRVVSPIPQLTPDKLVVDSADLVALSKLSTPKVPDRVAELARSIIAGSTSDFQAAARLEQYLLTNYVYDLRVPNLSRSGDVVDSFLFERQAGYCAQFSTAMAVMARLVGLPARAVIGYVPGEYNSLTGAHTVRLQHAHAWVEIKFRRHGWVPFDPTPRADSPWALDRGAGASTKTLQQIIRADLKDIVLASPGAAANAVGSLFAQRGAAAGTAGLVLMAFVLVALVVAWRRRGTQRHNRREYTRLRGVDRQAVLTSYAKALRVMARKGYPRREAHQSPGDYVDLLVSNGLAVPDAFSNLSRQASEALYDPSPLDDYAAHDGRQRLRAVRSAPSLP